MANIGSLGIGGALANALNVGLQTGEKFAQYEQNRYLESSAQVNKLSSNQADIQGNHNREMMNASMSPQIANLLQQAPRTEVQGAQLLQSHNVANNAVQGATNQAVIQGVLNTNPYMQSTQVPTTASVDELRDQFLKQLQLNAGNPDISLRGVLNNGY